LIIRLIIQTIRQDRSGSVQIDEASNVSRPDPSGADQGDDADPLAADLPGEAASEGLDCRTGEVEAAHLVTRACRPVDLGRLGSATGGADLLGQHVELGERAAGEEDRRSLRGWPDPLTEGPGDSYAVAGSRRGLGIYGRRGGGAGCRRLCG
jgi:hypothetical protein